MKRLYFVLFLILAMFMLVTPAFADWFGPGPTDIIKVGPQKQALVEKALPIPPPEDFMSALATVLNNLGTRGGYAYDFKRKEAVTYLGSTILTKWNIALDVGMLNADGVAVTLDYNVGSIFPNIGATPIIKYIQYLYVGGGYDERYDSNNKAWAGGGVIDAQFKFTF